MDCFLYDRDLRYERVKCVTFTIEKGQNRCHHIEPSQLICSNNQMTGFYKIASLALS